MTLTKGLGNCITTAQATRLDILGIGLEDLVNLRKSSDKEGFLSTLKEKCLRSNVLREKQRFEREASSRSAAITLTEAILQSMAGLALVEYFRPSPTSSVKQAGFQAAPGLRGPTH